MKRVDWIINPFYHVKEFYINYLFFPHETPRQYIELASLFLFERQDNQIDVVKALSWGGLGKLVWEKPGLLPRQYFFVTGLYFLA